jgi:hypothetical protein
MSHPELTSTAQLVERAFWWLVGIASTLFISAVTAIVGVLWHMNGSIVTLNERVGMVIEARKTDRDALTAFDLRLRHVEEQTYQKEKAVE